MTTQEKNGKEKKIEIHDLKGLNWILKMHAEKKILRRDKMEHTEGELKWEKEKFKQMGHTGKSNLLFFLAKKTGSVLKSRSEVKEERN